MQINKLLFMKKSGQKDKYLMKKLESEKRELGIKKI